MLFANGANDCLYAVNLNTADSVTEGTELATLGPYNERMELSLQSYKLRR